MKINPRARLEEAREAAPGNMFGEYDPVLRYHTCEVLRWNDVAKVCNYAASVGYRLHTLRDGARGTNIDFGYRMIFERVS